jgi:hypothetical protein
MIDSRIFQNNIHYNHNNGDYIASVQYDLRDDSQILVDIYSMETCITYSTYGCNNSIVSLTFSPEMDVDDYLEIFQDMKNKIETLRESST